jgi:serine protease
VSPKRFLTCIALVLSAMAILPAAEVTASPPERFRDGVVLVGYEDGTSAAEQRAIEKGAGGVRERVVGAGTRVVKVAQGGVGAAIARLRANPSVRYAEPDYILSAELTPNDPRLSDLWAMRNVGQTVGTTSGQPGADIDALAAWDFTTGSRDIVVGVVDTGIDYFTQDLNPNIWNNPGGIGGCATGTRGYDAINNDCDPRDDHDHGTHVAGIIGATGNNGVGITGVNWTTSLMGLKFMDYSGKGPTSELIEVLDWAIRAKQAGINLRVLNGSFGGADFSQGLLDMLRLAGENDILFVTSAGNTWEDNDAIAKYPCNYDSPNIICVAATTSSDVLWNASSYGATTVDLAAPGANILSILKYGFYEYKSGTSMAAPHVAGGAALMLSQVDRPMGQLRSDVLAAVDPLPALQGKVATGGRFNVCRGIVGCVPAADPPSFTLAATPATATIKRGASAPFTVTVQSLNGYQSPVTLSAGTLPAGMTATFSRNPLNPPTTTTSTMTLKAASTTKRGTYNVWVTAAGSGLSKTSMLRITIS